MEFLIDELLFKFVTKQFYDIEWKLTELILPI